MAKITVPLLAGALLLMSGGCSGYDARGLERYWLKLVEDSGARVTDVSSTMIGTTRKGYVTFRTEELEVKKLIAELVGGRAKWAKNVAVIDPSGGGACIFDFV